MMKHIGKDSGLDYDLNVTVDDGLLTCETCGRLPGYYRTEGEAIKAARLHLGKNHTMLLAYEAKEYEQPLCSSERKL